MATGYDPSGNPIEWVDPAEPERASTPPAARPLGPIPDVKIVGSHSSLRSPIDPRGEWPPVDGDAFHGICGEIVGLMAPHTEASPVALLVTLLTALGNMIGAGPHARVGGAVHPARLNVVLVGATSRGRKGQSWADAGYLLQQVDQSWFQERVMTGLSSGEGVIAAARKRMDETSDGRLFVYEPEFAKVLKAAGRDTNTLSAILREAYDSGNLATLTRHDPLEVRGAHLSILAHITADELRVRLSATDIANGFGNRFMFIGVERAQLLPSGGTLDALPLRDLVKRLAARVKTAQDQGVIRRSPEAETRWAEIYALIDFSAPTGLGGAITARAEAHCLRLSLLYALLDGSAEIDTQHVEAAFALWNYAESCALATFDSRFSDRRVPRLLAGIIDAGPTGLDGRGQHAVFSGHASSEQLERWRGELESQGLIRTTAEGIRGRSRTVCTSTRFPDGEANNAN